MKLGLKFTNKHKDGSILTSTTPILGRMSAIVCPIGLEIPITAQKKKKKRRKEVYGTYIYTPSERCNRRPHDGILIYRNNFFIFQNAQRLCRHFGQLVKGIKKISDRNFS